MEDDLLKQQDLLQREAHKILTKLDLIKIISEFGKARIIGSLDLGLMVWRDIDIEVMVKNSSKEDLAKIVEKLSLETSCRVDFTILYNDLLIKPNQPKGTYLGIKYYDHLPIEEQSSKSEKIWKIDIWFLTEENIRGSINTDRIKAGLTDENKMMILKVKNDFIHHPDYRKLSFSLDIYNCVLEKGVKNSEDFKKYLKEIGKEI